MPFLPLLPLLVQLGSGIIGWFQKRKLVSEAFAKSFYSWVDSLGERSRIPAELRQRVLDQRARLDATDSARAGSPTEKPNNEEKLK